MTDKRRTTKEKITLGLSFGGGIGIFPFAIYRLSNHEWAIGIADLAVSLGMLSLFIYSLKTNKIDIASKILAAMALLSIVTTISLKGISEMYWAYPAIVSILYLLKPKIGLFFALITITLIFFILNHKSSNLEIVTIIVTLLVNLFFAYIFTTEMNHQQLLLSELATKDPLTGAGNRRALKEKMENIIGSFQRSGNSSSLLLIDMDFFKKVNDSFGHDVGDSILIGVTKIFKSRIRINDNLYRYGGEEFIMIAENTSLNAAKTLAEQLRETVEKSTIISGINVTISVGIAELSENESKENWIKRADKALFEAKESGRNKVCTSPNKTA